MIILRIKYLAWWLNVFEYSYWIFGCNEGIFNTPISSLKWIYNMGFMFLICLINFVFHFIWPNNKDFLIWIVQCDMTVTTTITILNLSKQVFIPKSAQLAKAKVFKALQYIFVTTDTFFFANIKNTKTRTVFSLQYQFTAEGGQAGGGQVPILPQWRQFLFLILCLLE